jgi:hypothetical protein
VFGPGDRHLVPEMVAMLRARQFVRLAGGRPPLELTYSENLADAVLLATLSDTANGESFLVGDGYGVTLVLQSGFAILRPYPAGNGYGHRVIIGWCVDKRRSCGGRGP